MRPICINHGCYEDVTYSHKDTLGNPRWRVHCSHCQSASWGKWPHRAGVTPYKIGKCSNTDGHLGFDCMVNWEKIPSWAKGMTEVDHKDGNNTNNDLNNLDELCPLCHKLKGQQSGDFNNMKHYGNRLPVGYKGKRRTSALFQFTELFEVGT
jgi:hypothetical protein